MAVGVRLLARPLPSFAPGACSTSSESITRRPLYYCAPKRLAQLPARGSALKRACVLLGDRRDWRQTAFSIPLARVKAFRTRQRAENGSIVCDLGGEYTENFDDVEKHLVDYFTYKAVKTVMAQLLEMNPSTYRWLYSFVVDNPPQDSVLFIRALVKEKQELAERVMVTRLHLYNQWIKKYDHANLYKSIQDQNLQLLRERLMQTVKFEEEATKEAPKES